MQFEQIKSLLANQTELISKIVLESDLVSCLNDISLQAERALGDNAKASVITLENQYLYHSAAPNLPSEFCQFIDNLLLSQDTNPCTSAAYLGKPVIVPNIEQTPFCDSFVRIALSHQLRSCWAMPLFSSTSTVLGIFAIYYPDIKTPDSYQSEVLKHFTFLAGLAIEKQQLIKQQEHTHYHIEQLAFYDALTELPNRRLLMSHTQDLITKIKQTQLYGALIYIDLNGFKRINDSLGHHSGDELLVAVSRRLKNAMRKTDTIARIGGDEFVVLVEDLQTSPNDMKVESKRVANRILQNLEQYFNLAGGRYKIGASIGIALIDHNDKNAIEVLKHADAAMYSAKKSHQQAACFHNSELQDKLDARIQIENEISTALKNAAFHAFFQPMVDLNGKLIAAEALIRWKHPDRGIIGPDEFITVAENMGVIHQMQDTMLTQVCQTLKRLEQTTTLANDFRISINICPSQLKSTSLPNILMKTLREFDLPPRYFMLEITEGMLVDDLEQTANTLNQLRNLGFNISIDDFGTGYSSLAYLNTLPISEIKIDKCFIDTLSSEPSTQSIVDSMISLSKHFNFNVIAEGIEDAEQLEVIRQKEVKGLQGYLFAKPMNQEDFIDWICI